MKRNHLFILLIIFSLLNVSETFSQSFVIDALSKIKVVDFGSPKFAVTYEDVGEIIFQPRFEGCKIPTFKYSDLPSGAIAADRKDSYLGKIVPGALIIDSGDGNSFIQSHFYLDYGYESESGWVKMEGTPNMNSQDPGRSRRAFYCLRPEYKFVKDSFSPSSLSINSDGNSCSDAQNLCDSGCEHFGIGNPIIKNFKSKVENQKSSIEESDAKPLEGDASGIFQVIVFKDRTPPWVDECSDNKFPTLGETTPITTGDWFSFDDLTVKENKDSEVKVKIAMGLIDKCPNPNEDWTKSEDWNNGTVQNVTLSGSGRQEGNLTNVISPPPNNCYGYMRYTVFAQDKGINSKSKGQIGNLNPGCASIEEDNPNDCYGLPRDNKYFEDLSTSPGNAKAWPYRANRKDVSDDIANKMSIEGITGEDRVHEGYIRITDNDFPNILIRLKSAKYGNEKQIFFPPCMPAGALTIVNSSAYSNDKKSTSQSSNDLSNQNAYNEFVGESHNILKECNYNEVKNSNTRPYFTILDLVQTEFMNNSDISKRDSFLNNKEPSFINKHFRLEDQTHSDTDSQGRPDETLEQNNESLLGKRNGTWKKVVALVENLEDSEVQIQEDVEYELGVWVDDSVKWANSYPQEKNINSCESINIPIPSGINYGKITIDIPNQSPSYKKVYDFPKQEGSQVVKSSIHDSLRIVFREPTPDVKITSAKDLKVNKFPSITVEATDFSGNQRIIQLYFRVKDENAKIKTLQRRHQQY